MAIIEIVNGYINDFVWGVPCLVLLSGQVVKLKKEYFGERLPKRK